MGLIETINKDILKITTNLNEFGVEMTLTTPDDVVSADIDGLHSKHHLAIDTDGNQVNSKSAHISFSEQELIDKEPTYPIRNANGEVDLKGHKVTVKDSTGIDKNYVVREWFPDETIGLIVCILGDFE
jgi:hypothetical protein